MKIRCELERLGEGVHVRGTSQLKNAWKYAKIVVQCAGRYAELPCGAEGEGL